VAYLSVQQMVGGRRPLIQVGLRENLAETDQRPTLFKNADFRSIFARSASAVTSSEKVQLTGIGNPLRAFQ